MHDSAFLANAPLGIVVIADSTKSDVWIEDASIATIFIILAAEAVSLGSCRIQIRKRKHFETILPVRACTQTGDSEEYIRNILSIPDNRRVLSIVGIGYPDETKSPKQEEELQYNKKFLNQYGNLLNTP